MSEQNSQLPSQQAQPPATQQPGAQPPATPVANTQEPPATSSTGAPQQSPPATSQEQAGVFTPETVAELSQEKLQQLLLHASKMNEIQKKQLDEQKVLADTLVAERNEHWNNDTETLFEIVKKRLGDENAKEVKCALDNMHVEGQSLNSLNEQGKVLSAFVKCGTAFEEMISREHENFEQMKREATKTKVESNEDALYRQMRESFGDPQTLSTSGRFIPNSVNSAERQQQQFQSPQQTPVSMQPPPQKRMRTEDEVSEKQGQLDYAYYMKMMDHLKTGPPATL